MKEPDTRSDTMGREDAQQCVGTLRPQQLAATLLQAGPVEALFADGGLRYIKLDGNEIVRGVYAAVRDKNWGTVPPAFTDLQVERYGASFCVRFTAEHVNDEIDFVWDGRIEGTPGGTVTFAMDGRARRAFLRNRIGFCVLHPVTLAGEPVTLESPEGIWTSRFPELISPDSPFIGFTGMRHGTAGGELELRFEGDRFETEDQRNWTDASFKTFSTPLAIPYPVLVENGEIVRQRVTLRLADTAAQSRKSGSAQAGVAAAAGSDATNGSAQATVVTVGPDGVGRLPKSGVGYAPVRQDRTDRELDLLAALRPAHLHVPLRLGEPGWLELLTGAAESANFCGAELLIEAIAAAREGSDRTGQLEALAEALQPYADTVCGVTVYPEGGFDTTLALNRQLASALAAAGVRLPIGGGTRGNFAEFNRAELPLEDMDYAVYPINPQIHAFDDASIIETLEAQSATVRTAKARAGSHSLHVGPVTFKPRVNPYAANEVEAAKTERRESMEDARLRTPFGAVWTLGCIAQLGQAGADRITLHEDGGTLGLMPEGGASVYPVYELLKLVGEWAGAELLDVRVNRPLAAGALALRLNGRRRLIAANYTDAELRVHVAGGEADAPIRKLTLAPYGFACLDSVDGGTRTGRV
ncbi:hypothetical protein [Cohnella sp. 56]|uniref:hypothetical protein n=1 Tax=Cohnella sp. 56 TaxID=3113722 RepID=UPI0030E83D59